MVRFVRETERLKFSTEATISMQDNRLGVFMCEICGATGINAHTASHCQYVSRKSLHLSLVKSPHQSNGQLRNRFNMPRVRSVSEAALRP
ncbi:hypothetical protein FOCC_FOCC013891 [Frankliniella occidentalis]|nr:hypothetical protein FOCC_FOCC013891 [Frankliniella occidentalis]